MSLPRQSRTNRRTAPSASTRASPCRSSFASGTCLPAFIRRSSFRSSATSAARPESRLACIPGFSGASLADMPMSNSSGMADGTLGGRAGGSFAGRSFIFLIAASLLRSGRSFRLSFQSSSSSCTGRRPLRTGLASTLPQNSDQLSSSSLVGCRPPGGLMRQQGRQGRRAEPRPPPPRWSRNREASARCQTPVATRIQFGLPLPIFLENDHTSFWVRTASASPSINSPSESVT